MLKKTLLIIAFSISAIACLKADISKEQATVAIATFLADPLAPQARNAAEQVLSFAEATPDHEVVIEPKYLPWLEESNPPQGAELLLVAFIAGNLSEQIKKQSSKPEPYAGVLSVIGVYKKIQAQNGEFRIDSVEKWISLENQGRLKEMIEKEEG